MAFKIKKKLKNLRDAAKKLRRKGQKKNGRTLPLRGESRNCCCSKHQKMRRKKSAEGKEGRKSELRTGEIEKRERRKVRKKNKTKKSRIRSVREDARWAKHTQTDRQSESRIENEARGEHNIICERRYKIQC